MHDAAGVGVAVVGEQYSDDRVESHIALYDAAGKILSATEARMLAAGLLDAADVLEQLR
jgi:hypothetical protein